MPRRPSSPMALTASAGKRASRSHSAAKGASRSAAKLRAMSRIMIWCSFSDMGRFPPSRAAPSTPLAARAMAAALLRAPPRRHLDLDPHARIDEAGDDGGGGGPDIAEIPPRDGRDFRPVLGPGGDVGHPDPIPQRRPPPLPPPPPL